MSSLTLQIGGHAIALRPARGGHRATVDLQPRRIVYRRAEHKVSEGGGGSPNWETLEGDIVDLDEAINAVAKTSRTDSHNSARFSRSEQWGHFRQNRFVDVEVRITDAAVEVELLLSEQDDSYY